MNVKISGKKLKCYLFALLVISFNFGDYFKVAGRPFSQYLALLLMLFSVFDLVNIFFRYKELEKEKKLVLLLVAAWLLIGIVQVFWVVDAALWKHGMRTLLINLFICFEMCVLLKDEKDYFLVMKSVEISLLLSVAVGICEIFMGIHFDSNPEEAAFGSDVRSFFGNPNDYATWIILCLLGVTLYYAKRDRKFVCFAEWVLGAFVISHTRSRAGMLSLLAAAFFAVIGLMFKAVGKADRDARRKQKDFHILGIVSAVALGSLWLIGSDVETFISNVSSASSSDIFRVSIIKDSLAVALRYALMGAGASQTTFYVGINPHNFLLELLADYGILITGAVVYILWKIFIRIFEKEKVAAYQIACYAFTPTFLMIGIASSSMARLRMTWVVLLLYYFASPKQEEKRRRRVRMVR